MELMVILAEHVPFTPNIADLSKKLSMSRNTLVQYLHYLDKARLINTLYAAGKGYGKLEKPGKILLENTNLFAGQLTNAGYHLSLHTQGDFEVDRQFVFEVGAKTKASSRSPAYPIHS